MSPAGKARKVVAIASARACGPCTACCDGWVRGTIRGHEMQPGTPCHFRVDAGCSIYAERPRHPCRAFVCEWLAAGSPFPETFRPDLLQIIVTRFHWRGRIGYTLVPAGRAADPALLQWMREFSLRTGRPFIYEQLGDRIGFGPQAFLDDLQRGALPT